MAEDGFSQDEIKIHLDTIRRLYKEFPEKFIEISFDVTYIKTLTGNPEKDGFTSTSSVFMMESTGRLEPGKALDVGAGQGRNAVWLAQQGWDVTGIDISGEGLAAAEANAKKSRNPYLDHKNHLPGFRLWKRTMGPDRYDPVLGAGVGSEVYRESAHIVSSWRGRRFRARPGNEKTVLPGLCPWTAPNALLEYFRDFCIQKYEKGVWQGDWRGPPAELVRMIARKKVTSKKNTSNVRLDQNSKSGLTKR